MATEANLPELVGEIPRIPDEVGLRYEVEMLRRDLTLTTEQMALERDLAMQVHHTRSIAILGNPTLSTIFEIDDDASRRTPHTSEDILTAAFLKWGEEAQLPEGFANRVAKQLRIETHPDHGHDADEARAIAGHLKSEELDPVFSLASALAARTIPLSSTSQSLRDERYHLTIAISGSKPRFETPDQAKKHAHVEIEGAEWRIRTQAAFKCFGLIIGSGEVWNRFLQQIAQEQHMPTIEMVNRNQPAILGAQERIIMGDPIQLDDATKQEIDKTLEWIWTTLHKTEDSILPYTPPYAAWLPIILPVLLKLDPGEKPGVEYSYFEPPFQIQRNTRPAPSYYGGQTTPEKSSYISSLDNTIYKQHRYDSQESSSYDSY